MLQIRTRGEPGVVRLRAAAVALVAAAALAGCGSGFDEPPFPAADVPVVDALLVAPVDDVDGLTVKGVELDARDARHLDDDGVERPVSEVEVGMTVEVDARIAADGSQGVARVVKSTVALEGPVDAVGGDAALVAVGTQVRVDPSTALAGVASAGALRPGDAVRVYGLHSADGSIAATRIERVEAPFARVRVRGTVTALDPSDASFALGTLRVSYRGASIRGSLAEGARVVVRADRPPVDGRLAASSVDVEPTTRFPDGTSVAIEGLVSGFRSLADFRVGGVPVDGARASVVGDPAALRDGVRVTVRGAWRGDRIDAASIAFFATDRPRTLVGIGPVYGTPLFWGPSYWGPGWFPWVPARGVGFAPGVVRGPFSSSWLSTSVPPRPPGPLGSGAGGAFSRPVPPGTPSLQPGGTPSSRPMPSVRPTPGGPRGGWLGNRGRGGARGR